MVITKTVSQPDQCESARFLSSFEDLEAEPLQISSGTIWTALNIDYPGHSFSHLGVFFGRCLSFSALNPTEMSVQRDLMEDSQTKIY
jgi:hypothetical protein